LLISGILGLPSLFPWESARSSAPILRRITASGCETRDPSRSAQPAFVLGIKQALSGNRFSRTHPEIEKANPAKLACSEYAPDLSKESLVRKGDATADPREIQARIISRLKARDLLLKNAVNATTDIKDFSEKEGDEIFQAATMKAFGFKPALIRKTKIKLLPELLNADWSEFVEKELESFKSESAGKLPRKHYSPSDLKAQLDALEKRYKEADKRIDQATLYDEGDDEELRKIKLLLARSSALNAPIASLLDDQNADYFCCMRGFDAGESHLRAELAKAPTDSEGAACVADYQRGYQLGTAGCQDCKLNPMKHLDDNTLLTCATLGMRESLGGCRKDFYSVCKAIFENEKGLLPSETQTPSSKGKPSNAKKAN